MNINRENIEEHLFEYFEGDMSMQDSDTLMDFIHQNPSYEKDFVQWKKAYHHVDEELESFGMNNQLKKIATVPFYQLTWFKIATPTLLITISAIGLNFINSSNLKIEENLSPTTESLYKDRRPSNKIYSLDPSLIINNTKASSPKPNRYAIKSITQTINKPTTPDTILVSKPLVLNNTGLETAIDSIDTFSFINDSLMNKIDPIEIAITENSTITQDSVSQINQPIIEPKQNSKKSKKRKASRTTKALPINPNF